MHEGPSLPTEALLDHRIAIQPRWLSYLSFFSVDKTPKFRAISRQTLDPFDSGALTATLNVRHPDPADGL